MPDPIITFGFIVSTLFGAAFHLLVGGDARRLALFLLAGWLGFALGHVLGVSLDVEVLMVGELRMLTASIGAVFALFAAYILLSDRSRSRIQ